jgi:hypothetical protein
MTTTENLTELLHGDRPKITENLLEALIAHTIDDLEDITVYADCALDVDAIDLWYEVKTNPNVIKAFKTIAESIMDEAQTLREIKLTEQTEAMVRAFNDCVMPFVREQYESDGVKDQPARREAWCNFIDSQNKDGEITDYEAHNMSADVSNL